MTSSHCLVSRPSSIFKCIFACSGLMLAIAVGSFSLCYIFFTSMFLIMSTVYFTFISAPNPEDCPNYEEEAVNESVVAEPEGCGIMHRGPSSSAIISENQSTCDDDDDDDDQCITASEDDDDDNVARSSLSSEDDGSISDEDTLIEIELPTGHYSKQKLPDADQHSCNMQEQRWNELLSEANSELATEEDNFIEIDISIGSIMYPRFEIRA